MKNGRERQSALKNRLTEALDIRGMKASELCEKTGIPKGAISYYKAGKSQPKADRLYSISVALNVSEAWLLGYDVPMERTAEQKKNDQLAGLIVRMRSDTDFFEAVSALAKIPTDKYNEAMSYLLYLGKK